MKDEKNEKDTRDNKNETQANTHKEPQRYTAQGEYYEEDEAFRFDDFYINDTLPSPDDKPEEQVDPKPIPPRSTMSWPVSVVPPPAPQAVTPMTQEQKNRWEDGMVVAPEEDRMAVVESTKVAPQEQQEQREPNKQADAVHGMAINNHRPAPTAPVPLADPTLGTDAMDLKTTCPIEDTLETSMAATTVAATTKLAQNTRPEQPVAGTELDGFLADDVKPEDTLTLTPELTPELKKRVEAPLREEVPATKTPKTEAEAPATKQQEASEPLPKPDSQAGAHQTPGPQPQQANQQPQQPWPGTPYPPQYTQGYAGYPQQPVYPAGQGYHPQGAPQQGVPGGYQQQAQGGVYLGQPVQGYQVQGYPQMQGYQQPYQWNYRQPQPYATPTNTAPPAIQTKKGKKRGLIVFLSIFLVLALATTGIVYGVGRTGGISLAGNQGSGSTPGANVPQEDKDSLSLNITKTPTVDTETLPPAGEAMTVPQVAKKVSPSVVGVMKYSQGNLFEETGLGSGIIMSIGETGNAYIISNAHVVEMGSNFMIRTWDNNEYDASLVGLDTRSDLAILQISAKELGGAVLKPAELGTSSDMQVGEMVVAIGNPVNFELSTTVTQGIISAVDRVLEGNPTMKYLQTDAAINPGNSGGALVNTYGQVIGINTLKVKASGYEGLGFAIPISSAIPILEELIENGTVISRAMLGVTAGDMGAQRAEELGVPAGVLVTGVSAGGRFTPEILPYDIITHCEGERVLTSSSLHLITDAHKVGDTLELQVYRKSSTVKAEELLIQVVLISAADFIEVTPNEQFDEQLPDVYGPEEPTE